MVARNPHGLPPSVWQAWQKMDNRNAKKGISGLKITLASHNV
jgi:hypothetical protein